MGLNKTVPDTWVRNCMAGADWMTAFLKRNSTISLRCPEAKSLSRATSVNKVCVDKLEGVNAREQFTPDRIWNIDETGCTTVQTPIQIVAATGIKQIGTIVSAECGQLVMFCCAVSATGNNVPPMLVFPMVNYRDHFVNGAPTGSAGTTHPLGWTTSEGFLPYIKHFAAHVRQSPDDNVRHWCCWTSMNATSRLVSFNMLKTTALSCCPFRRTAPQAPALGPHSLWAAKAILQCCI